MWECMKCHERHEDAFEICWQCGTSKTGVEDPSFRSADEIEATAFKESRTWKGEARDPASRRAAESPLGQSGYEFTPQQNQVIAGLAMSMRIVGFVYLVAGVLLLAAGIAERAPSGLIQAVLALVIGGFTVQAASAFRRIIDSQGDDIGNLMTALQALRSLYQLLLVLMCIGVAVVALAFCLVTWQAR